MSAPHVLNPEWLGLFSLLLGHLCASLARCLWRGHALALLGCCGLLLAALDRNQPGVAMLALLFVLIFSVLIIRAWRRIHRGTPSGGRRSLFRDLGGP